jgi:hypothetical protein
VVVVVVVVDVVVVGMVIGEPGVVVVVVVMSGGILGALDVVCDGVATTVVEFWDRVVAVNGCVSATTGGLVWVA